MLYLRNDAHRVPLGWKGLHTFYDKASRQYCLSLLFENYSNLYKLRGVILLVNIICIH